MLNQPQKPHFEIYAGIFFSDYIFPSLQYGTRALDKVIKTILGQVENKVQPPKDYVGGPINFIEGKIFI